MLFLNNSITRQSRRTADSLRLSAVLIMLSTCLLLSACNRSPTLPDSVDSLVFKTLSGQDIALASVKGPVLINFWATDCAICIHEMPDMAQLYADYASEGFELIAVAMSYDPPNRVLEMAEREQWLFPVALDVTGEATASFESVKGTPTSFLLDKDGQLVERYIGAIPMDTLRKQLDRLLELG